MNLVRNFILLPVLLYQSLILALAQIRASKMRSTAESWISCKPTLSFP